MGVSVGKVQTSGDRRSKQDISIFLINTSKYSLAPLQAAYCEVRVIAPGRDDAIYPRQVRDDGDLDAPCNTNILEHLRGTVSLLLKWSYHGSGLV